MPFHYLPIALVGQHPKISRFWEKFQYVFNGTLHSRDEHDVMLSQRTDGQHAYRFWGFLAEKAPASVVKDPYFSVTSHFMVFGQTLKNQLSPETMSYITAIRDKKSNAVITVVIPAHEKTDYTALLRFLMEQNIIGVMEYLQEETDPDEMLWMQSCYKQIDELMTERFIKGELEFPKSILSVVAASFIEKRKLVCVLESTNVKMLAASKISSPTTTEFFQNIHRYRWSDAKLDSDELVHHLKVSGQPLDVGDASQISLSLTSFLIHECAQEIKKSGLNPRLADLESGLLSRRYESLFQAVADVLAKESGSCESSAWLLREEAAHYLEQYPSELVASLVTPPARVPQAAEELAALSPPSRETVQETVFPRNTARLRVHQLIESEREKTIHALRHQEQLTRDVEWTLLNKILKRPLLLFRAEGSLLPTREEWDQKPGDPLLFFYDEIEQRYGIFQWKEESKSTVVSSRKKIEQLMHEINGEDVIYFDRTLGFQLTRPENTRFPQEIARIQELVESGASINTRVPMPAGLLADLQKRRDRYLLAEAMKHWVSDEKTLNARQVAQGEIPNTLIEYLQKELLQLCDEHLPTEIVAELETKSKSMILENHGFLGEMKACQEWLSDLNHSPSQLVSREALTETVHFLKCTNQALLPSHPVFYALRTAIQELQRYHDHFQMEKELTIVTQNLKTLIEKYQTFLNSCCQNPQAKLNQAYWHPVYLELPSHPGKRWELIDEAAAKLSAISERDMPTGNSVVKRLGGIFFKLAPTNPGVEFQVGSFYREINGHSCPPTDLVQIFCVDKRGQPQSYYYQASLEVTGVTLDTYLRLYKPEAFPAIDPVHYAQMVLLSLCTNPPDAKPDNLVVFLKVDKNGKFVLEFRGIDNEMAFAPDIVVGDDGLHRPGVKNILYFLSYMNDPIPASVRAQFENLPVVETLLTWLKNVEAKSQSWDKLSKPHPDAFKNMQLPIEQVPGQIMMMYERLVRIQKAIKEDKDGTLTLNALFKTLQPELHAYYYALINQYHEEQMKGSHLSLTDYFLTVFYDENGPASFEDIQALKHHPKLLSQLKQFQATRVNFEKRGPQRRKATYEEFFKCLDFPSLDEVTTQTVLQNFKGIEMNTVRIQGSRFIGKDLTDLRLCDLLRYFNQLTRLQLIQMDHVTLRDIDDLWRQSPKRKIHIAIDGGETENERASITAESLLGLPDEQRRLITLLGGVNAEHEFPLSDRSQNLLLKAVETGVTNARLLRYLERRGVNFNVQVQEGNLFNLAVSKGHLAMAKLLHEYYHLSAKEVDAKGNTAFHLAAISGHEHLIRYLLTECRLNEQVENLAGQTVIDLAVSHDSFNTALEKALGVKRARPLAQQLSTQSPRVVLESLSNAEMRVGSLPTLSYKDLTLMIPTSDIPPEREGQKKIMIQQMAQFAAAEGCAQFVYELLQNKAPQPILIPDIAVAQEYKHPFNPYNAKACQIYEYHLNEQIAYLRPMRQFLIQCVGLLADWKPLFQFVQENPQDKLCRFSRFNVLNRQLQALKEKLVDKAMMAFEKKMLAAYGLIRGKEGAQQAAVWPQIVHEVEGMTLDYFSPDIVKQHFSDGVAKAIQSLIDSLLKRLYERPRASTLDDILCENEDIPESNTSEEDLLFPFDEDNDRAPKLPLNFAVDEEETPYQPQEDAGVFPTYQELNKQLETTQSQLATYTETSKKLMDFSRDLTVLRHDPVPETVLSTYLNAVALYLIREKQDVFGFHDPQAGVVATELLSEIQRLGDSVMATLTLLIENRVFNAAHQSAYQIIANTLTQSSQNVVTPEQLLATLKQSPMHLPIWDSASVRTLLNMTMERPILVLNNDIAILSVEAELRFNETGKTPVFLYQDREAGEAYGTLIRDPSKKVVDIMAQIKEKRGLAASKRAPSNFHQLTRQRQLYLLSSRISPADKDDNHNTYAHYAARSGDYEFVNTLIRQYQVSGNERNTKGETAWEIERPVMVEKNPERTTLLMDLLLKQFSCQNLPEHERWEAIHHILQEGVSLRTEVLWKGKKTPLYQLKIPCSEPRGDRQGYQFALLAGSGVLQPHTLYLGVNTEGYLTYSVISPQSNPIGAISSGHMAPPILTLEVLTPAVFDKIRAQALQVHHILPETFEVGLTSCLLAHLAYNKRKETFQLALKAGAVPFDFDYLERVKQQSEHKHKVQGDPKFTVFYALKDDQERLQYVKHFRETMSSVGYIEMVSHLLPQVYQNVVLGETFLNQSSILEPTRVSPEPFHARLSTEGATTRTQTTPPSTPPPPSSPEETTQKAAKKALYQAIIKTFDCVGKILDDYLSKLVIRSESLENLNWFDAMMNRLFDGQEFIENRFDVVFQVYSISYAYLSPTEPQILKCINEIEKLLSSQSVKKRFTGNSSLANELKKALNNLRRLHDESLDQSVRSKSLELHQFTERHHLDLQKKMDLNVASYRDLADKFAALSEQTGKLTSSVGALQQKQSAQAQDIHDLKQKTQSNTEHTRDMEDKMKGLMSDNQDLNEKNEKLQQQLDEHKKRAKEQAEKFKAEQKRQKKRNDELRKVTKNQQRDLNEIKKRLGLDIDISNEPAVDQNLSSAEESDRDTSPSTLCMAPVIEGLQFETWPDEDEGNGFLEAVAFLIGKDVHDMGKYLADIISADVSLQEQLELPSELPLKRYLKKLKGGQSLANAVEKKALMLKYPCQLMIITCDEGEPCQVDRLYNRGIPLFIAHDAKSGRFGALTLKPEARVEVILRSLPPIKDAFSMATDRAVGYQPGVGLALGQASFLNERSSQLNNNSKLGEDNEEPVVKYT